MDCAPQVHSHSKVSSNGTCGLQEIKRDDASVVRSDEVLAVPAQGVWDRGARGLSPVLEIYPEPRS